MAMQNIDDEINSLNKLDRKALIERWEFFYKNKPPKGLSTKLMVRAIAYQMQVKRFGGLRAKTIRQMKAIAAADKSQPIEALVRGKSQLDAGTRLVREWNGVTHVVDVTDNGFVWHGKACRSLSAIAYEITGVRWSGPRFFGLNGAVKEKCVA